MSVPQPEKDYKNWPHAHNWGGGRNHCTFCDKWCVDNETERRIRADELERIKSIILIHHRNCSDEVIRGEIESIGVDILPSYENN